MAILLLLAGRVGAGVLTLGLSTEHGYGLNNHVETFEDKHGNLTLSDVLATGHRFRLAESEGNNPDKGFTLSAYWFRVKLRNTSHNHDWSFHYWGSLSRSVKVYMATGTGKVAGDFVQLPPLRYSRGINYHLRLLSDVDYTLYYRIQDRHVPLVIGGSINPIVQQVDLIQYQYPLMSFIVGGLLILVLYNFLYFLYLQDTGFLVLSLFILTFTLEMGGHAGLWQSFSWMREHLDAVGALFGVLCVANGILILRQWLDMPHNMPGIDRLWRYVFWCTIFLAVACPFIPFSVVFLVFWTFCLSLLALMSLVLYYRQGMKLPWSIFFSGMAFILLMTPSLLRGFELIDETANIAESSIFGLLLALMLLSLSQAEQMQAKKKQAERIAATNQAKDEFLATMSHELRTPMNSVVSAGQLLRISTLSRAQSEYVNRLNTSSKHMLSLISDILDMARMDQQSIRIEHTRFHLKDILYRTEQLLTGQLRNKPLKLVMDNRFHPLRKQLIGDPVRLQQILLNLLNNAIKFTAQGEVSLTITSQEIDNDVTLLFEIRDTGIGITKEQQAELFKPFSQADSSTSRVYGGSGLGLAISVRLVGLMGGELQVKSKPEQGSRFYFSLTFPLQDEITNTITAAPRGVIVHGINKGVQGSLRSNGN